MPTLTEIILSSSLKERLQLSSLHIEKAGSGYKARLNFRFLESREVPVDSNVDLRTQYLELASSRLLDAAPVMMPLEEAPLAPRRSGLMPRGNRLKRRNG